MNDLKYLQELVFDHLKKMCEEQARVRRGEVEGMILDHESWIKHVFYCGLITLPQVDELENLLD